MATLVTLFGIALVWTFAPLVVAARIAGRRGGDRVRAVLLAVLLGWIGVLIVASMYPKQPA